MLLITNSSLPLVGAAHRWNAKLLFLCLMLISMSGQADSAIETEIRQLETSLLRVHQKQQSLFQQFQMIQELRRYELIQEGEIISSPPPTIMGGPLMGGPVIGGPVVGGPLPSYEEMVKQREVHQKRLQQYTEDLDELYAQYQELETEKKMLMEQIDYLLRSQLEQPAESE